MSGPPEAGPSLTESQRQRVKATKEDFEDSLSSREQMREYSDPGRQWQSPGLPADEFTRSEEIYKLDRALQKCVIALVDVYAQATLGLGSAELYRTQVDAEAAKILNWAIGKVNHKDRPYLDRPSLDKLVKQRVLAWVGKAESQVPPPSWMDEAEPGQTSSSEPVVKSEQSEQSEVSPSTEVGPPHTKDADSKLEADPRQRSGDDQAHHSPHSEDPIRENPLPVETPSDAEVLDFASEAGRNEALRAYTKHWVCSEASLARTARVNRADLSKWKKGLLPIGSDKKKRIEDALKNNAPPTPPAAPRSEA